MADLPLEYQIRNQGRIEHDFHGANPAYAAFAGYEPLRNKCLGIQGEIHEELCTSFFREEVDNSVQCLVRAVRVKRCQAQVTGFRELDAVLHRLPIANFADQYDIGRLPQRVLQCSMPAVRINTYLTLGDDTSLMRMHVFDRVFDRNDVAFGVFVTVPDHRREGG